MIYFLRLEYTMTTPNETPDMATLLKVYQKEQERKEKRRAYLQTEEGKEQNRIKSAIFYERNRERVLEKRKEKYEEEKDFYRARNRVYYAKKKALEEQKKQEEEERGERGE